MNRFSKTSATSLIVAVGLSAAGHAPAQIQNDNSAITQATCEERLFPSKRPARKTKNPGDSTVEQNSEAPSLSDWSDEALDLLSALNSNDFEAGTLSIIDCVGSSNTARVRTQRFELENFIRGRNESRGWLFSFEGQRLEEPVIQSVKLEIPPRKFWQINGTGLIATEEIFFARSNGDFERFPRVRKTEVIRLGGALQVTQRTTTNDLFDELVTWTLMPK